MRFETRHEEPPTADPLPIPDLSGPCVLKRVIRTVEQLGVRISSGKVAQITGRRQGIWIVLGHIKDLLAKKLDRAWVEDALSKCRSNCQTRPVYGGSKNWTLSRHTVPKTNENVVSLFFHKKWVRGVNGKAPPSLIMVCDRGKPNLVGGTVINRSLVSGPEYLAANWLINKEGVASLIWMASLCSKLSCSIFTWTGEIWTTKPLWSDARSQTLSWFFWLSPLIRTPDCMLVESLRQWIAFREILQEWH